MYMNCAFYYKYMAYTYLKVFFVNKNLSEAISFLKGNGRITHENAYFRVDKIVEKKDRNNKYQQI